MSLKILEFVTIIAVVVGRELPKEPDRGFRYNCWIDLCTFPLQYCDLDEQRCQYCSDDLCKSGSYPEQCKSYCTTLLSTSTQSLPTTARLSQTTTPDAESNKSISLVLWMTFAAVCSIILILVIYIYWSCWKRTTSERKQYLTTNGQHLVHPVGNESVHSDRRDASTSTPIGGIQDSTSGREGPHENLGDHRLLHDSESSLESGSTAQKSCEPIIPLQPTASGHMGPSHEGFKFTLLDEKQRSVRFVTEEQQSNGSCDSGYRDNSSPSYRHTNQKTVEGGATPENCPLLRQCTQDPAEETTFMKTYSETQAPDSYKES